MSYIGAQTARSAREKLGQALASFQQQANIPDDIMTIASNVAQAVGALFEAERASSERDGRASVKNALGTLSQTLALLQDVPEQYRAQIDVAIEAIANAMSALYPLANARTIPPVSDGPHAAPAPHAIPATRPAPPSRQAAPVQAPVVPSAVPSGAPPRARTASSLRPPPAPPVSADGRADVEANIGATTESNFYVGFSGEISEGGVFLATYDVLPVRTSVALLVTLPGGFEFRVNGWVRYVSDPFDFGSEADPGMGIQFENLDAGSRELILRFVRKRPPTFFDD